MMFMPDVRKEMNLFDELTKNWGIPSVFDQNMKTDIVEEKDQYVIKTELPGYKKEEIQVSLQNGNLTICANHNETSDEKDSDGRVIRSERYHGSYERSFYVGDDVKESDIHATYANGILKLNLPKVEPSLSNEAEHRIRIE